MSVAAGETAIGPSDSQTATGSDTSSPTTDGEAVTGTIDAYGIHLDVFEGPLDLLLYLIRKSEVDIYDIPISGITAQFLAFLREVHLQNLESAADFILMAATLMKIKSQMLLPRDIQGEDLDEGLSDPREELVRKLLEYQQFKEIADWLGDQGLEQREIFARPGGLPADSEDPELQPVSLFDLLKVYKHVIDHVSQEAVHRIVEEEIAIEECIDRVLSELGRESRLRFYDLIHGQSRMSMVVTFVGLLELLKSQRIRVHQARPFDDIWIEQRDPEQTPDDGTDTTSATAADEGNQTGNTGRNEDQEDHRDHGATHNIAASSTILAATPSGDVVDDIVTDASTLIEAAARSDDQPSASDVVEPTEPTEPTDYQEEPTSESDRPFPEDPAGPEERV